jgi:hypothetical protein
MTDDLVKFLRNRFDEDEQVARGVQDRSAPWDGQWMADGVDVLRTRNGWVLAHSTVTTDGRALPMPLAPGIVDHWARHDPARVLAEVNAKREVVRLAERAYDYHGTFMNGFASALVHALRLFALPHAGHPDYRPEWAPEA